MTQIFIQASLSRAAKSRRLGAIVTACTLAVVSLCASVTWAQDSELSDKELQNDAEQALQKLNIEIYGDRDGRPPEAHLSEHTRLEEFDQLVALLKLANIRCIQINTIRLSQRQLRAIANLSGLREVRLAETRMSTAEFSELALSKSLSSIWILGNVELAKDALQELEKTTNLRSIAFTCNDLITNEHLAFLPKMRSLESLRFEECPHIGDDGVKFVGGARGLKRLQLSWCSISDGAMDHIAQLRKLERLSVRSAEITDRGIRQLQNCPNLCELVLYQTRVTAQGLLRLSGHVKLSALSLRPTLISSENLGKLIRAWPDLQRDCREDSWVWTPKDLRPWRQSSIDVDDGDVRIWDTGTGKHLMSGGLGEGRAEFLGDGRLALIGYSSITFLNVASGGVIGELKYPKSMVSGWADDLRFSPNGRYVALRVDDRHLGVYDTYSSRLIRSLYMFGECKGIIWSPDSQGLAFATEKFGGLRWRFHANGAFARAFKSRDDLEHFAFAPDGKAMAYSPRTAFLQDEFKVRILSFPHGKLITEFPIPGPFCDYLPDGNLMVHRKNEDGFVVFDPVSRRAVRREKDTNCHASAIAPDRSWSAMIAPDNEVHVVDSRTGKRRLLLRHKQLEGEDSIIDRVSISHDGRMIATTARPPGIDWCPVK